MSGFVDRSNNSNSNNNNNHPSSTPSPPLNPFMTYSDKLSEWRKTVVITKKDAYDYSNESLNMSGSFTDNERINIGESRSNIRQTGRFRQREEHSGPVVILPSGKAEIQDIGTTLGDLMRYYPNYYLVERVGGVMKSHRSAAFALQDCREYHLQRDIEAVDVSTEISVLNSRMEELIQENLKLQSIVTNLVDVSNVIRKEQLALRPMSDICAFCSSSLKFRFPKVCKLCDAKVCRECSFRVSYPIGFKFHKMDKPNRCCLCCLSKIYYLRHHPPPEVITESTSRAKEKLIPSNVSLLLTAGYSHEKVTQSSEKKDLPRALIQKIKNKVHHVEELDHLWNAFFFEGTFYTSGEPKVSLTLKFLDPLCRFTFWFSGMKDGDQFDRKTIDRVTGTKMPLQGEYTPYREYYVDVPYHWPNLPPSDKCVQGITNKLESTTAYSMKILLFTPNSNVTDPWPVVLFFHGGGFCVGRATDMIYVNSCSRICEVTQSAVISVDYRLAPEFRFPTQIEDGYAALNWVYNHAEELNINREKIIVCGDSAGGTIASVCSLMARDRQGPKIMRQILVYPCVQNPLDDSLQSQIKYRDGPILSRKLLRWFFQQLFGPGNDPAESMSHAYASPILSAGHNLPPATICNAQHDPLCDQGAAYASHLRSYGVDVTRSTYRKCTHGFFGAPTDESVECLMEICAAIRTTFGIDELNYEELEKIYKLRLLA